MAAAAVGDTTTGILMVQRRRRWSHRFQTLAVMVHVLRGNMSGVATHPDTGVGLVLTGGVNTRRKLPDNEVIIKVLIVHCTNRGKSR